MTVDQLPTPPPTSTTQAQDGGGTKTKTKASANRSKPRRTYEKQQENDRNYYELYIADMIEKSKNWSGLGVEDRSNAVLAEWKRLRDYRSKNFNMRSALRDYPDQYDARAEQEWVLEAFEDEIEQVIRKGCCTSEDQRDDEEDLPTVRGIKTEPKDDAESESGSDNEELNVGITECKVVSRGFVITEDEAAGRGFRYELKKAAEAKPASMGLKARDGPQGIRKAKAGRGTQRSWKWKGGKMVVWPPFDAFD